MPLEKLLNEENKDSVNKVAEHFLDESFMKKDEEMKYFVDNQCFSEDWTKEKVYSLKRIEICSKSSPTTISREQERFTW